MRFIWANVLLLTTASFFGRGPDEMSPGITTSRSTTTSATRTTSSATTINAKIEGLIRRLGDREFRVRERAQQDLAALGEAALPYIAANLQHKDPEIAQRLGRLVRRPDDPALRIQTVEKLIASADPDWVELGVYMLFRDPVADADAFRALTNKATGIERAMFDPVAEQLEQWKQITELHLRRQVKLMKEKPDAAEKERKMQADTFYYQAEAAYWQAVEAAEEFREQQQNPAPTSQRPTSQAASQPSK